MPFGIIIREEDGMELLLKDIAKVANAQIEINSVTVIAGYNGSGKTTISKALYSLLEASSSESADPEKVAKALYDSYQGQVITTLDADDSLLMLRDGKDNITLNLDKNGLSISSFAPIGAHYNKLYFKAPSRWIDSFSTTLFKSLEKPPLKAETELSKRYRALLEEYAKGAIVDVGGKLYYKDFDFPTLLIELSNTSSGEEILTELGRLFLNGSIIENSIIIIDEPETNLHPGKQVALARIIASLSIEFGIRFLLSSHNIYFIRALEVAFAEEEEENHKFYLMKRDDNSPLFSSVDVTDSIEEIYHELYAPMENL